MPRPEVAADRADVSDARAPPAPVPVALERPGCGIELPGDERDDLSGEGGWIRDRPSLGSYPRKEHPEAQPVPGTARGSDKLLGPEGEDAAQIAVIEKGTGSLDGGIRSPPRSSAPGWAPARALLQHARSRFPR